MFALEKILSQITQSPEWQQYQQYQQLVQCWHQITNDKIAKNTRPQYFHREVFGVATSSAVWAQELVLQRYSLLKKLNQKLDFIVKDIRFTPTRWNDLQNSDRNANLEEQSQQQKSSSSVSFSSPKKQLLLTPSESIQRWLKHIEAGTQNLPLCSQCHCPTPEKEIQRWGLCCHCMAQKSHSEYRPPIEFPPHTTS